MQEIVFLAKFLWKSLFSFRLRSGVGKHQHLGQMRPS